jgi:hypothetical protein
MRKGLGKCDLILQKGKRRFNSFLFVRYKKERKIIIEVDLLGRRNMAK